MDEFYSEWQKEENRGKDKWDILGGFSEAHQIAVVFGNFNYQVENGGLSQWIYNRYFNSDAEKFTDYLEKGSELDARFQVILDKVNLLDQYANETGCDQYGNYRDPEDEDGEYGFIGDLANCDAFDAWYYKHCGKDNWWDNVCEIIDQAEAQKAVSVLQDNPPEPYRDGPHERDGEDFAANHPLRVYIENSNKPQLGGFIMPLPAMADEITEFFIGTEIKSGRDIKIWDVRSDVTGMGETITAALERSVSPESLNELNYLAAEIAGMTPNDFNSFAAVIDAKRHCGSVAEIINVAENLSIFDVQPGYSEAQYGDFLLELERENTSEVFARLEKSEIPDERYFAEYVQRLENHLDTEAFGRAAAENENGVFTDHGYLTEMESALMERYRGPQDIPAEYRIVVTPLAPKIQPSVKVTGADLPALLMEMHALGGDYMRDAKYNLNALVSKGDDFILTAYPDMLFIVPATEMFRKDTSEHRDWTQKDSLTECTRVFVLSVTSRDEGSITGDLCEADFPSLRNFFRMFNVSFTHLDAEMADGATRTITADEYNRMDNAERGQIKSYRKHYAPADEEKVTVFIDTLRWAVQENRQPVTPTELAAQMSAAYMSRAAHPQPDMLRVAQAAAQEILAKNAAPVFRLTGNGPEQLSPIDAVKTGLWYSTDREFAVKREDLPGAEKWASRAAEGILRQAERGEKEKPRGEER
jgi:hypothetical protein